MPKIIMFSAFILTFIQRAASMTDASTNSSPDPVVILAVSTVLGQENSTPIGSLFGGTTIYFKVQGLDQTASNNAVMIGKYPCIISDKGVNGLYMNCKTTKPDPNDDNLQGLSIVVSVAGKSDSICIAAKGQCTYQYSDDYTPFLKYVTPRSNYPQQNSMWRARWTVSSNAAQYLDGQFMGTNRCDRFNIKNKFPETINSNDDYVMCQVSAEIEAGYYTYTIKSANGYQQNDVSIKAKKVTSDETYDSKIVPIITEINSNFISPFGKILQIKGYGFSVDPTKNAVLISGFPDLSIEVLSSSINTITAKVSNPTGLPKLSDITGSDYFIQGSGLFATVWNMDDSMSCSSLRTQIQSDPSVLDLQFDGIYAEPELQNMFGDVYGLYFRGFLRAPITGNYKFYLSSDDCSQFYIQNVQTMKPISSDTLAAEIQWWSSFHNYWEDSLDSTEDVKSITNTYSLTQDEYYFIEVYHVNSGGAGHLTLSMEVENSGSRKANSLTTMYTIQTSYTAVKEVIEVSIYNSNDNKLLTGKYQLQFTYGTKKIPQTGVYYKYVTSELSASTSAAYMEYYLNNLGGYKVSVVATKLDKTGQEVTSATFAGYKYTITFESHRGTTEYRSLPTIVSSTLGDGTVVSSIKRIQEPQDPISGTFQLTMTIDGVDNLFLDSKDQPDLSFDVSNNVIANNIEKFTGVRPIVWNVGRAQDGQKWYVKLRQDVNGLSAFTIDGTKLISGNGAVTATITKTFEDSNNLLFEPIPNELLFTYSTKPQVQVKTNNILAGCSGICDLTLSESSTPTLKQYTLSGNTLTLTIETGADLPTIKAYQLSIQFKGAECTFIQLTNSVSPYTVTCQLEQLNSVNIEEAGDNQLPIVNHNLIGFVKQDATLTQVSVDLTITSVTPDAGSPDGGTQVTLTGTGFPKNADRTFTLTIGGTAITPLSVNNQQIIFITLQGSDGSIELKFNSKSQTATFTYDNTKKLEVTKLEFTEQSPIYRGLMTITGTNFGTVVADVKVTLIGETKQYNAKVITVTDTSLSVYLRGGMPGEYKVVVTRKDWGTSTGQKFKYIIPVESVTLEDGSQAKGSEAGGTVILIKGSNFIKDRTMVFIGNAVNWICEIDQSRFKETEIYCTVPPKHNLYTTPQTVVVTIDITLESQCIAASQDDCKFTYDSTLTPQITSYPQNSTPYSRILFDDLQKPDYERFIKTKKYFWVDDTKKRGLNHILQLGQSQRRDLLSSEDLVLSQQKVYTVGDSETIAGSGLTDPINVLFKGPVIQSVVATFSDPQITYTIPNLPQGEYETYIVTNNGYGDKIWMTIIELRITSVSTAAYGGEIITINGQGFNADYNPTISIGNTKCTEIDVVSTIEIKCRMFQQSSTSVNLILTQKPSNSNSAQLLTASTTLTINTQAQSPAISSLTINGVNTYDSTKKYCTAISGDLVINFIGTLLTGTTIKVSAEYGNHKIQATDISKTDTSVSAKFTKLPIGQYNLYLQIDNKYASSDRQKTTLIVSANNPTSNNPTASFAGGATLTLTGSGFDPTKSQNQVKVCGFVCPIISATETTLSCETPFLPTTQLLTQYIVLQTPPYIITSDQVTITSDSIDSSSYIMDTLQSTYYVSKSATNCYVQINFGTEQILKLHSIRYLPRINVAAQYLKDAIFQYTTDGTTWSNLLIIDQTVHSGWNSFIPQNDILNIKAFRLFDTKGTSGSSCQIAEIELKGWILSTQQTCPAIINVNGQQLSVNNAVTYSTTPIVETVNPQSGRFTEEAQITITGTGFIVDQTTVNIDGVECTIQSVTTTQIVCKTGIKDLAQTQLNGVFQVRINGNLAINKQKFIYATKWSDIETWGGYEYPGDGDSVIVNMGQTLIVDVKTPKLMQLLVEGTLTFSDEMDTSIDAHYIIIREGEFYIGQYTPHQHNVQITLYGNEGDVQMPAMGNKVLGCHQCKMIINGKKRTPTWTLLSSTVEQGATIITVDDVVDWQIGEQIMITSSEVDHLQSEKRIITQVSADKKTLTLNEPLSYKHYSAIEQYGTEQFAMKVEVALLSRNIIIQGEQSKDKYGYHLMIHGKAEKGTQAQISYTEFRYGGQPKIIGRYPIHFHLNGEVDNSYVIGNSIHDCYARCLTIHGVHFLKVQNNVCYNTFGHAIFFEDGIETNNVLEDNLVASTRQSWIMLQTDITVATYWVTNPQNILRRNRSGGSEWYGFWYEIKVNPDGPSATSDICPPGLNILEFSNNYAHSNGRFGLRILQLVPRQYPCRSYGAWQNESPFLNNPSIQAVFQKFYTWKNNECGILGEELGNVVFKDIMIADSKLAGFQAHKTNYSSEGAILDNALIVGKSNNNGNEDTYYQGSRGIIVPRTNGFQAQNIRFYNFIDGTILIESCSQCLNGQSVQGGKNTQLKNIKSFNSVLAKKIFWQQHRREIFWDQDGTFSSSSEPAYIVPYKIHLDSIDGCTKSTDLLWDNSLICLQSKVTIRDVMLSYPTPNDKFQNIQISKIDASNFETEIKQDVPNDGVKSIVSIFATGFMYNIKFNDEKVDFEGMGIFNSPYFTDTDKGIVLRFPYTTTRETFDIYRNIADKNVLNYTEQQKIPDVNTCNQGDWYNDKTNKYFFICLSGKNKKKYEYIEVRAILCRDKCDSLGDDVPQEDGFRTWSDPETWSDKKVPVKGDSPTIAAGYQVILDCDTPELDTLTILGTLIFDDKRDSTTLQAKRIWVKAGKLIAGTSTTPFPGKITIKLLSDTSDSLEIQEGQKTLAISKGIELYSTIPQTVWTRLQVYANAGTTSITVTECTDWKIDDEIVIGPSGGDPDQAEKKKITALSGCQITLDSALKFDHYGGSSIIDKTDVGKLDMRAVVAHLTRKIRIQASDDDNQGCRVAVYQYDEQNVNLGFPRRGYAQMHGVEFINCGQKDYQSSGLDFLNLNSEIIKTPSEVNGCSFHDGKGIQLTVLNSQYVTITNNVFYNGIKALAQINNSQYVKFKHNALIYVQKPIVNEIPKNNWATVGTWAALGNFIYMSELNPTQQVREFLEVTDNVGQGSQDTGFFVTASKCSDKEVVSLWDIHCSTVVQACFAVRQDPEAQCSFISQLSAHNSEVGLMFAAITNQIQISKVLLAENKKGLVLKQASSNIQDNVIKLTNFYFTALARPDCKKCYAESLVPMCSRQIAMQLGITGTSAFPPISQEPSAGLDLMCTTQRVDLRVYIEKAEFENYRMKYTDFPQCQKNAVFRQHPGAEENNGIHYLVDSPCANCEFDALLYDLKDADQGRLGWFGGCGSFVCTGKLNFFVEDQTGSFFGEIGQAIPNNSYFGPNVTYCERQESWNGYWCPGRNIQALMFMSTAADYNKRLYSPIQLTDGQFFNQLNSYHEWMWLAGEPMNTRESKFIGLVTSNTVVNMTNAGMNPTSSEYWISKRKQTGSPEDFIIVQWQFQVPQIIQVLVNNKVILPGLTTNSKHHDLMTMTDQCGANNYFFENRTIHFVLNGQMGCKVKISLKNTLQVSTRLEITEDQFFGDKFIQYARAQLGGDPYNYFIIGTKKTTRRFLTSTSAVQVDWGIADSAEIGSADGKQSSNRLADLASKLESLPLTDELKALGVVGLKTESSSIQSISELNFKSSELKSNTESNGNSGNTGSNQGGNQGQTNPGTQPSNNTQNNEDIIIYSPDESVNIDQQTEENNMNIITKLDKKSEDKSYTLVIVLAVVLPIVGIAIIIIGFLFFRRIRAAKVLSSPLHKTEQEGFRKETSLQLASPNG